MAGLPPGRALDLGAGEGRNAAWLAARGWDVTAVDFSRAGLARAHEMARRAGADITTVLADLSDYVPAPAAFDLVLALYVQVPGDLLATILGRASTALAPGGTVILIGHDLANLENGFGGPQDPSVLQTAAQVTAALGDDLVIEAAGPVERLVETPGGPRTAIDVLVRAQRPAGA